MAPFSLPDHHRRLLRVSLYVCAGGFACSNIFVGTPIRQRVEATGLDLDLVRGREHGREREEEGALQWIAFSFLEEKPGHRYI